MCFDFLHTLFLRHFSFYEESAKYCHKCTNIFMQSSRYSCLVVKKLEFSRQINSQTLNFMKIHPMGAELFYVVGQTLRS